MVDIWARAVVTQALSRSLVVLLLSPWLRCLGSSGLSRTKCNSMPWFHHLGHITSRSTRYSSTSCFIDCFRCGNRLTAVTSMTAIAMRRFSIFQAFLCLKFWIEQYLPIRFTFTVVSGTGAFRANAELRKSKSCSSLWTCMFICRHHPYTPAPEPCKWYYLTWSDFHTGDLIGHTCIINIFRLNKCCIFCFRVRLYFRLMQLWHFFVYRGPNWSQINYWKKEGRKKS